MKQGCFIMVDGIDGSGKSTVTAAWKEYLAAEGNAIFDLRDCWKERGTYPEYDELKSYDFIFSGEPTYAGIGKVIREELIKNGTAYPTYAIAEAYSLDRLILYTKIIIPTLRDGKCVIQDRGVSTSLCYQSLGGDLTFEALSNLPGNALALQHRPDHLVLMDIAPEIALQRLAGRREKQDNVIFEKLEFQKKAAACFSSPDYQKLFTDHGASIHYLPAHEEAAIVKAKSLELLHILLT